MCACIEMLLHCCLFSAENFARYVSDPRHNLCDIDCYTYMHTTSVTYIHTYIHTCRNGKMTFGGSKREAKGIACMKPCVVDRVLKSWFKDFGAGEHVW